MIDGVIMTSGLRENKYVWDLWKRYLITTYVAWRHIIWFGVGLTSHAQRVLKHSLK